MDNYIKVNFEDPTFGKSDICRTYWNYSSKHHNFQPNWHNEYEFIYIVSGVETVYIENDCYIASPGDIVAINRGRIHTLMGEHFVHHCIIPSEQLLDSIGIDGSTVLQPLIHNEELSEAVLNILKTVDTDRKYKKQFQTLAIQQFLLLMFENHEMKRFDAVKQKRNPNLEVTVKVIDYLRKHLAEDFSIDEIAKGLDITTSYMCRCVKAATNMSIIDHLNRLRCQNAKHYLMHSDKKISEIAAICGYQSNSYFAKTYQKIIGYSPNETPRHQFSD